MNSLTRISLAALAAGAVAFAPVEATAQDQAEAEVDSPTDFHVFWKDGLRAETNDGQFQIRLGGRLHTDISTMFENEPYDGRFGRVESSDEIRRARLFVQGYVYERVEYKFEVDFAGGKTTAKDMYMGVRGWPVTARFGHQKEPFSLEEQVSSRFITFTERSLVNMFAPSRNLGLMLGNGFNDGRSSWAAGVFRETDGFAADPGDNYNFTGRLTHALLRSDDSRQLLHLGVALQHREVDGTVSLSTRPGDHLAPKLLSVRIPATSANTVNVETSVNIGSLGLQAEYVSMWVQASEAANPRVWGYYAQGSYFLTGETRPYSGGKFVRLKPARNFPGGPGAWEIGVRYSLADLSEAAPTSAHTLWNLTVGLNWYWNPNVRMMFNYDVADLDGVSGDRFSSGHMRVLFDF